MRATKFYSPGEVRSRLLPRPEDEPGSEPQVDSQAVDEEDEPEEEEQSEEQLYTNDKGKQVVRNSLLQVEERKARKRARSARNLLPRRAIAQGIVALQDRPDRVQRTAELDEVDVTGDAGQQGSEDIDWPDGLSQIIRGLSEAVGEPQDGWPDSPGEAYYSTDNPPPGLLLRPVAGRPASASARRSPGQRPPGRSGAGPPRRAAVPRRRAAGSKKPVADNDASAQDGRPPELVGDPWRYTVEELSRYATYHEIYVEGAKKKRHKQDYVEAIDRFHRGREKKAQRRKESEERRQEQRRRAGAQESGGGSPAQRGGPVGGATSPVANLLPDAPLRPGYVRLPNPFYGLPPGQGQLTAPPPLVASSGGGGPSTSTTTTTTAISVRGASEGPNRRDSVSRQVVALPEQDLVGRVASLPSDRRGRRSDWRDRLRPTLHPARQGPSAVVRLRQQHTRQYDNDESEEEEFPYFEGSFSFGPEGDDPIPF